MKLLSSFILAILCTSAVIVSSDSNSTVTSSSSDDSSSESVPTTTAVVPTSSKEPPTTTTSEPSTTAAVTTTTPSTTTVSSTTVVSTTAVSTTSESPATTEAPKPPAAEECSWNITQNNVTCIRVQLKVRFTIHGEGKDEYIVLSQNASSDHSSCHYSNETQLLALHESNYDFTMTFEKAAKKVFVNSTTFRYTLPDGISGYVTSSEKLFTVNDGNSYMCHSTISVKLGNDTTMEIFDMHVQAFGNKDNTNFSTAEECADDDKVSDAVPIAVGCALAALIIIVLIAYLVGRRQSRQRGYQSV